MRARRALLVLVPGACLAALMGLPAMMVMGGIAAGGGTESASAVSCDSDLPTGNPVALTTDEQRANAKTIVQTGVELHVPRKAQVIAIATAMQESTLRNLSGGDRDSIGLFQQRRLGWGTAAQRHDPATAARMFYKGGIDGAPGLLDIPGWQSMEVTLAAQAVQRSAYPFAYRKWESLAERTVTQILGDSVPTCQEKPADAGLPDGAVGEMLKFALAQQGEPYVFGAVGPDAWDCSGLVVGAWRAAGYRLKIRTAAQMAGNSDMLARSQAQPGDLIFGEWNGRVSGAGHVMIVVNDHQAVEAPYTGAVVKTIDWTRLPASWRVGRLRASAMVKVS